MVKSFILFLLSLTILLSAEDVKIEVALDSTSPQQGIPLTGSIIITHPSKLKIDPKSFSYDGKPLAVDFLNKVEFAAADPVFVETYRFSLPPFSVGLQVLNAISAKVGGKSYSSIPSSFEVKKLQAVAPTFSAPTSPQPASSPSNPAVVKPTLKLEKIFKANEPLYPGYKAVVGYRYSFEGDIDLQKEVVPLLDLSQFKKLGEKMVEDRQDGPLSIREITQNIEFVSPGTFEVPSSKISGYAYIDRGWGPKNYIEPLLQSEVPSFSVVVNTFPNQLKPPFFYGAIGPFQIKAVLEKPPQLEVGDRFVLKLTFTGTGVLSSLKPPNLFCQPNWAGFFEVGDLPPQGQKKENEVTFAYELRPLTPLATRVPAVFLSYFDPQSNGYKTVSSEASKIKVVAEPLAPKPQVAVQQEQILKTEFKIPSTSPSLQTLTLFQPESTPFGSSSTLLLIPAALFFWWFKLFYEEREAIRKLQPIPIEDQLKELKKDLADKDIFAEKAKSFISKVWKGESYPTHVADLMEKLDAMRWAGEDSTSTIRANYYQELVNLCTQNGKLKSMKG